MKSHLSGMYHPFSTARTRRHVFTYALILIIPLVFLCSLSYVAQINVSTLFENLGISLWRILAATVVSVVFAWVSAVLFYRGRASAIALPIFDVLQSLPTSAAMPVAVLYFGNSGNVVIFFLVLAIVWPVFFSIVSSLKLLRRDWEEAVEMSGIRRIDYLRYFLIPVTLPGLITGTIIGLGEGWEALIATEIIVGSKSGLGQFFVQFAGSPGITLFGILCILVIIFALNKAIWLPLLEKSHRLLEE